MAEFARRDKHPKKPSQIWVLRAVEFVGDPAPAGLVKPGQDGEPGGHQPIDEPSPSTPGEAAVAMIGARCEELKREAASRFSCSVGIDPDGPRAVLSIGFSTGKSEPKSRPRNIMHSDSRTSLSCKSHHNESDFHVARLTNYVQLAKSRHEHTVLDNASTLPSEPGSLLPGYHPT
ncbi:hypothetical protein BX600DRAFT_432545 [Xylariales sp. PMI_506]|nr:hypothetical protein BX600DRAFT_432545 [Xylariales sp. PMI_506]